MSTDEEHLWLLSIFHYILGGLGVLMGCFPFIHLALGIAILSGAFDELDGGPPPPAFAGWIFVFAASWVILMSWTLAVCLLLAGRKLSQRTSRTFCLVVAGIECLFVPFGTVLGVFTIVVLSRPSVKRLFDEASAAG